MSRTERKPIEEAEFTVAIDLQAANAPAVKAEQELAEIKSAFGDEQRNITLAIGQRLGRKSILNLFSKFSNVTDLLDIQKIKESKQYKGYTYIDEHGNSQCITTFAEYCIHIEGRSVESIDLDLRNLKLFGEEFFDAMQKIGIGPGTMRDLRALPEDERQALLQVAQEADKDAFVDLASTLIAKHEADKQAAKKQQEDLKATLDAKDAVVQQKREELAKKDQAIDKLNEKVALYERKALTATPDEKAAHARNAFSNATLAIKASIETDLRGALNQLMDTEGNHEQLAGACILELMRELRVLRDEFRLPHTIDDEAIQNPIWKLALHELDGADASGSND